MRELIVEPAATAQWQKLVREAAENTARPLDETLESYLVFVLLRFSRESSTGHRALALDYLEGLLAQGRLRAGHLRDVGDHCLLLAGFFPQRVRRRRVGLSYYIDLGRSAYRCLAETREGGAGPFAELARGFVVLTDVLRCMRELDGQVMLSPLEAMDLWQRTGSGQARATLDRLGAGRFVPVRGSATRQ